MEFLFVDETNTIPEQGNFFIVGGLILGQDCLPAINREINEIRLKYGFKKSDSLKFSSNSRPEHLSNNDFNKIKVEVIELLQRNNARMIVYVILHQIADPRNKFEYAYNVIFHQFDRIYLKKVEKYGMIVVDRLPQNAAFDLLIKKFVEGVDSPQGTKVPLERVVHLSVSADNTSNMSSALDIALGAFRYCVNAITHEGNLDVASKILPKVSALIWGEMFGNKKVLADYGFLKFPRKIKYLEYEKMYASVVDQLTIWSNEK